MTPLSSDKNSGHALPRRFEVIVTDRGDKAPAEQRYEAKVTIHHPDQRDPWDEVVAVAAANGEREAIKAALDRHLDGEARAT